LYGIVRLPVNGQSKIRFGRRPRGESGWTAGHKGRINKHGFESPGGFKAMYAQLAVPCGRYSKLPCLEPLFFLSNQPKNLRSFKFRIEASGGPFPKPLPSNPPDPIGSVPAPAGSPPAPPPASASPAQKGRHTAAEEPVPPSEGAFASVRLTPQGKPRRAIRLSASNWKVPPDSFFKVHSLSRLCICPPLSYPNGGTLVFFQKIALIFEMGFKSPFFSDDTSFCIV